MSRVLFVVAAFVCIALSCAAQENELKCGGGRCAVTLDAPTNEEKKKIVEARKKRSSANAQVGYLAQYIHTATENCEKGTASSNDAEQAKTLIEGYVEKTEKYLEKFTGLNADQGLKRMKEAVPTVTNEYAKAVAARDEICASQKKFSDKRGEVFQMLNTVDAAMKTLEAKFSEELFNKIKADADKVKTQAEELQKEFQQEERQLIRRVTFVEEIGNAAEELREQMYSVFQGIEHEYNQCDKEFKSKSNNLPFRKPGDPDHSEALRLQICQKKKKEENAENSKKVEDEESKKMEPPATKNPQPTLKPKEEAPKDPQPTLKPKEEAPKDPQPTLKPKEEAPKDPQPTLKPKEEAPSTSSENDKNNNEKDDNKRGGQNDGAARHAVLKNALFACLFVAGLSVLTTA